MTRLLTGIAIVVVITSIGFVAPLPAQQPPSIQSELLTEVRLLRQAIQTMAGSNARVQIVFGRLTLQEQRTANAAKRLDDKREALRKITQEIAMLSAQAETLERMQGRKPEDAPQAEKEGGMLTRMVQQMEAERLRLVTEEADAANELSQEQGRWSDLNRQLEELERALARQQ
ncbi:MAG TPA: hypothetical protein VFZ31_14070 [Vicinamibacterales bacterium]